METLVLSEDNTSLVRGTRIPWSEREVILLKASYGRVNTDYISQKLGHPIHAVHVYASTHDISTRSPISWESLQLGDAEKTMVEQWIMEAPSGRIYRKRQPQSQEITIPVMELPPDDPTLSEINIKDSGNRTEFPTGSVRDIQEGKGRYDLIPPEAIYQLALIMEKGAEKYGERNWEKGQPLAQYWNSAMRHWMKVLAGWTDEPHASQALWNIACYIQTKKWIEDGILPKELDDIPKREKKVTIETVKIEQMITDEMKHLRETRESLAKTLGTEGPT